LTAESGELDRVSRHLLPFIVGDGFQVRVFYFNAIPLEVRADAVAGTFSKRSWPVEEFDRVAVGVDDDA